MTADWTVGDTVQVTINAADLASPPNVMSQDIYSYSIVGSTGGPYPQSTYISSASWSFPGKLQSGVGSDQWPMTWAGDNNIYTIWDDGGGLSPGSSTVCRTQFGVAKMTGSSGSSPGFVPIFGCQADGDGCLSGATHDAGCDAPYASTIAGYGEDIIALDNTLYSIATLSNYTPRRVAVYKSTNFAQTWVAGSGYWSMNTGGFIPTGFVQYGMGYAGGDNTFVYMIGIKAGTCTETYMARVPRASVENTSAYTWYSTVGGSILWGTWGGAMPIHVDTAGGGSGGHMVYNSALSRYILTQAHGGTLCSLGPDGEVQKFGVYESVNPWGPWYTVYYSNTWGAYGTSMSLYYTIPVKWISTNGLSFWMAFSGGSDGTIVMDSLNLIQGSFILAAPAPPTGVSVGSYFYGQYFYGSMY
jgi:hypothetical protein